MGIFKKFAGYKTDIQIIIIYFILTAIFTYPVIFSSDLPGLGDLYQYLWFLWWFDKSILNFANPYYTMYIYYPTGVNLAFSAMNAANSILSIPFQEIFSLVWTYKIVWLSSFFIAGYGTYLLVKYLTNNKLAAFIAGLIFMFNPYHFARGFAGHLNLIVIQWMPFYILYLYKTIHENKKRNPIYAAIFLLINSTEYYYFIYMIIFSIIFLIYNQLVYKNILKNDVIRRLSILYILFGILFLPFIIPLLKELLTTNSSYMYTGGYARYSADFLAFFIPTPLHPIFGQLVRPIYKNLGAMVFMGYTAIFLAIISISKVRNKENRFWILSMIISILFALGPVLHINGNLYNIIFLPYNLLEKIPIISIARAPHRWDVLVMLSLAVIAGYGLDYLFKNRDKNFNKDKNINKENGKVLNGKVIFTILLSGLIIFEYLAIPFPMSSSKIPEFYHQLKNETGDFTILELPNLVDGITMYYQTFHEKRLVNGYVSRLPPESRSFKETVPIINLLYNPRKDMIINKEFIDSERSILKYYKIKYIILHQNFSNKRQIDNINYLLQNISIEKKVYEEDRMIVYTIYNNDNMNNISKPFILFKNNWFGTKISKDKFASWMINNATILGYSPDNEDYNLSLESRSYYRPRFLEIYLNDELVNKKIINTKLEKINLKLKFKKGENIIRLYTPDTCQRPIDSELKSNDTRCLSLLFSQRLS